MVMNQDSSVWSLNIQEVDLFVDMSPVLFYTIDMAVSTHSVVLTDTFWDVTDNR